MDAAEVLERSRQLTDLFILSIGHIQSAIVSLNWVGHEKDTEAVSMQVERDVLNFILQGRLIGLSGHDAVNPN